MTRVVLTLPKPRADRLAARLAADGHQVAILAFRHLVGECGSPDARRSFAALAAFDWVVFVSPGAIAAAAPALPARWPAGVGIALVGPGSVQALRDSGVDIDEAKVLTPSSAPYDADALMRLAPFHAPAGARVLVVAGDRGRGDWIDALEARGARVERLRIYRNQSCVPEAEALELVGDWSRRSRPAVFVCTSVDAVDSLAKLAQAGRWHDWASRQPALAPHAKITSALAAAGWRDARTIEPGDRALRAALESV